MYCVYYINTYLDYQKEKEVGLTGSTLFYFREKYTLFNGRQLYFKEVIIMMNFIILAAGVMVGTLAATGVMVGLLFNKKVMKAYFNYAMKLSEEIVNEKIEEMSKEEEEA